MHAPSNDKMGNFVTRLCDINEKVRWLLLQFSNRHSVLAGWKRCTSARSRTTAPSAYGSPTSRTSRPVRLSLSRTPAPGIDIRTTNIIHFRTKSRRPLRPQPPPPPPPPGSHTRPPGALAAGGGRGRPRRPRGTRRRRWRQGARGGCTRGTRRACRGRVCACVRVCVSLCVRACVGVRVSVGVGVRE